MTGPDADRPLALQRERTALAWDRTGVGLIVGGALFVRAGEPPYVDLRHAPGVAAIVLGIVLIVFGYKRYERVRGQLATDAPTTSPAMVIVTGLGTAAFACAALVLILLG